MAGAHCAHVSEGGLWRVADTSDWRPPSGRVRLRSGARRRARSAEAGRWARRRARVRAARCRLMLRCRGLSGGRGCAPRAGGRRMCARELGLLPWRSWSFAGRREGDLVMGED